MIPLYSPPVRSAHLQSEKALEGVSMATMNLSIRAVATSRNEESLPHHARLCESDDPSLSVYPPFTCEYKDLKDIPPRQYLEIL
ncbi:hypothetical protein RclHR1_00680021 [Rhizophagus clarus]|uniref:Uncharacterized protein n=1 Tax=Rhizophagus clarus TaxID=94130 RepID=A0A2Z6SJI5_9GLOM|nr:hypothetical protein RclHR1_00680021 [Rhizophagus clarus]